MTLSWAFQPLSYDMEEEEGEDPGSKLTTIGLDSVAKIYSIKVTNTLGGGATNCLACPKGISEKG